MKVEISDIMSTDLIDGINGEQNFLDLYNIDDQKNFQASFTVDVIIDGEPPNLFYGFVRSGIYRERGDEENYFDYEYFSAKIFLQDVENYVQSCSRKTRKEIILAIHEQLKWEFDIAVLFYSRPRLLYYDLRRMFYRTYDWLKNLLT